MFTRRVADRESAVLSVFCLLLSLAFGVTSTGYRLGTFTEMGPGFIPLGLSILLGLCSLVQLWLAFRPAKASPASDAAEASVSLLTTLRTLLPIIFAVAAFALLVRPLGLLLTSFLVVVLARMAEPRFDMRGTLILAVILSAGASVIFVALLQLPINVFPRL